MDEHSDPRDADNLPNHPTDQVSTAILVLIAFGFVFATLFARGVHRGELVNLDHTIHGTRHYTLDINMASWPEWILLPGIGETLARRMVASREQDGLFQSHEDLLRVKGIGPLTLKNIRKYLAKQEPRKRVSSKFQISSGDPRDERVSTD